MSSITGLAQFTNRFAQNMMSYNEGKDKERERLEDKARELERQRAQDLRAQESHDTTQKSQALNYKSDEIIYGQNVTKDKVFNNAIGYEDSMNKARALQSTGQTGMAVAAILNGVNSNSNSTYTIDVDRDENGVAIELDDGAGNKYYKQSVIDKDTGLVLKTNNLTYDQIINSYTQLQNGQSIAESEKEAARLRAEAIEKEQSDMRIYAGKKNIDVEEHAINKGVDYGYSAQEIALRHGNAIDLSNNNANNAVNLAGVNHGYRSAEIDQRSNNSINKTYATAGINQGQAPNISGGGGSGPAWGSFDALIGPESRGRQFDSKGNPLRSPVGATGIAQVMPATGEYVAKKHGIKWDAKRYKTDANYNYSLGKLYYEEQLNKYGHPALAYAAYNAGPGKVDEWIKRNPAMRNPDAMGMQNFINAIPFSETKNYVAKIHRESSGGGGVKVSFNNPIQPKATTAGKAGKTTTISAANATPKTFNAQVDKGVDAAIKSASSYGLKKDPATIAAFAKAGGILKSMTTAKSYDEFLAKYEQAGSVIIDSMPKPKGKGKQLSKADENAIVHKVLLSMAGATSLGDFKDIMYSVNPAVRGSAGTKLTPPMLPGQQPRVAAAPSRQQSKLQALSARSNNTRGAGAQLPSLSESAARLSDANNNIDW